MRTMGDGPKEEERTFWLFVAMVQPLQGFWLPGTPSYHTAAKIMQTIVQDEEPQFHSLLAQHHLDVNMLFCSRWLHCLFTYPASLPPAIQSFAWGAMLVDGIEALFRVALALVRLIERRLPADPSTEVILAMYKAPPAEAIPVEAMREAYQRCRVPPALGSRIKALCSDYGDTWATRSPSRAAAAADIQRDSITAHAAARGCDW